MYPFAIHLNFIGFPVAIGAYDFFFFLAVAAACIGGTVWAVNKGFNAGKTSAVLAFMALGAVIGARALNFLVSSGQYTADPGRLSALSAEGFSLYGGMVAAAAAGFTACSFLKINPFRLGDTLAPWLGVSIAVMRIGCFLEGCCFGKVTNLPWGVTFPLLSPAHLKQIGSYGNLLEVMPVHPTQLYELAAALVLSIISFRLLANKDAKKTGRKAFSAKDGAVLTFFLTWFSLFRIVNFYLREAPDGAGPAYAYYPFFYLALFLAGLVIFHYFKVKRPAPASGTARTL